MGWIFFFLWVGFFCFLIVVSLFSNYNPVFEYSVGFSSLLKWRISLEILICSAPFLKGKPLRIAALIILN